MHPEASTGARFFSGEEQNVLDGKLSDWSDAAAHARIAFAKEALKTLRNSASPPKCSIINYSASLTKGRGSNMISRSTSLQAYNPSAFPAHRLAPGPQYARHRKLPSSLAGRRTGNRRGSANDAGPGQAKYPTSRLHRRRNSRPVEEVDDPAAGR